MMYLEAAHAGRVLGVVQHFADIVDAGVAGGVDFNKSTKPAGVDLPTGGARPHGSAPTPVSQFRLLARMRAMVVLPTPRVPVSR